ncbi:MAG: co-chaperone YbbN [Betaproteobacteria bacterium]|nr:co-chaperone YbbN [Betaproteobacteria bacterium]
MPDYSFDVGAQDFARVVIEGSQTVPVIVDFWAPWCGPCRMLKPILERLAAEYQGKFILAKVNSDDEQALASRYGVRGIPNVKAFVGGQMVDEFSGALPESAVREFVDRLIPSPAETMRREALRVAAEGRPGEALAMLASALEADPKNDAARVDAAELLLAQGRIPEAQQILAALSPAAQDDPRAASLLARVQLATRAEAVGDPALLQAHVAAHPDDLQARLDLAHALSARQRYSEAMDELLEVIRRDGQFGNQAARKTMLTLFNLLGGQDELVARYRRLLASALH